LNSQKFLFKNYKELGHFFNFASIEKAAGRGEPFGSTARAGKPLTGASPETAEALKNCGVMKLGRHALLSRGWGVRDKHSVMPDPTNIGSDWG